MMGFKERAFAPLVAVSLEDLVPQDHFYRRLERTLDLSFVRTLVGDSYAHGGRPSIDPVVFFKLQLVMFFDGIRSERQLMQMAADRLSVRWYLGYDLGEPLPDHSSLTRIRTRYGVELFRRFFDAIVEQCQQAGLVWGKELYVDATKVNANASLDSVKPRFFVEEHLKNLFGTQSEEGSEQTDQPLSQAETTASLPVEQEEMPLPIQLPTSLSPQEQEHLAQENAVRHDWIEQQGRPDRNVIRGSYRRMADFVVSTTDPDATIMPTKGDGRHLGYHTHYVVDGGKSRIILGVLVTPSEVMENQPMLDLVFRARFRHKLWPRQVTGDTTYGTIENIVAMEQQHIRAYVPLPDCDKRTSFYGKQQFRYDAQQDVYICPNNAVLPLYTYAYTEQEKRYQGDAATCNACPLKPECTTSNQGRVIKRNLDEEYVEQVRAYHTTEPYHKAMRKRSVWVEPLFAEGKDWHGMRRFRLRRLWRVNCEALIRAAGQNLKRLLKQRGWGRHPWPQGAANALSEPPAQDRLQLFAPMRAQQATACQQHLPVKNSMKNSFVYQFYSLFFYHHAMRNLSFSCQDFTSFSVLCLFSASCSSFLLFPSMLASPPARSCN